MMSLKEKIAIPVVLIILILMALIFLSFPSSTNEWSSIDEGIGAWYFSIAGIIGLTAFFIAVSLALIELVLFHIIYKFLEGYRPTTTLNETIFKTDSDLIYKRVKFFKIISFCLSAIIGLIHVWLFMPPDESPGSSPADFIMNLDTYLNPTFAFIVRTIIILFILLIMLIQFSKNWNEIKFKKLND